MELYLARHGQTNMNLNKLFYGWMDVELNSMGRQQSHQLADSFLLNNINPNYLYTSNLMRSLTTMAIIVQKNNWQDLPQTALASLNEINFGAWEGLNADQIQARDPQIWQQYIDNPFETNFPQGENFHLFSNRVTAAWQSILDQHLETNDQVVLIGHLGALRLIIQEIQRFQGLEVVKYWDIQLPQGSYHYYSL